MIYFNLIFIFAAAVIHSVGSDNIVLNKLHADIWEHCVIAKNRSNGATCSDDYTGWKQTPWLVLII